MERDYDGSVPVADILKRLEQGFEMLVPGQELRDEAKRHALSYMRHVQPMLNLEYMQCCRLSRNTAQVTPKIVYFYYQKTYF